MLQPWCLCWAELEFDNSCQDFELGLSNTDSVGGVLAPPSANPWLSSCLGVLHIVGSKFSIKALLSPIVHDFDVSEFSWVWHSSLNPTRRLHFPVHLHKLILTRPPL